MRPDPVPGLRYGPNNLLVLREGLPDKKGRPTWVAACTLCAKEKPPMRSDAFWQEKRGYCYSCANKFARSQAWKLRTKRRKAKLKEGKQCISAECENAGKVLPPSAFSLSQSKYLSPLCKSCKSERHAAKAHGFSSQLEVREFRTRNGGICEIAGCTNPAKHIDHDHATGNICGYLCMAHNIIIHEKFTPETLRAAADYLERTRK